MTEERLIDIEIKLTRQEDLVDTLNQMVVQQQKKINDLESLCMALARRISDASSSDDRPGSVHEKPPHY